MLIAYVVVYGLLIYFVIDVCVLGAKCTRDYLIIYFISYVINELFINDLINRIIGIGKEKNGGGKRRKSILLHYVPYVYIFHGYSSRSANCHRVPRKMTITGTVISS